MGSFNQKEYSKKYREANRERLVEYAREYRKKYPEKKKESAKKNFQKRKHVAYKRANERWKTDFDYRLKTYLRKRLRAAIKNSFKAGKSIELLGCSVEFFKEYISNKFKEGMSWDNYGTHGWHIDHIKPIASFDLTDVEQQKQCFNYTNMQPLWAKENHSKGAKYD